MATASMTNAPVMDRFNNTPSLLAPQCAQHVITMANTAVRGEISTSAHLEQVAAVFGAPSYSAGGKPFVYGSGIAIIPVWGALLHRDRWCDSWATGYTYIESVLAAALADDDVKGILWDINSYGGHVAGNFELCEMIYEARAKKPMMSIIDSRALSGGYSIMSAVGKAVAAPSAEVGSIGVLMMHTSYEKMLDEYGIKTTFVFAGDHKVDGNPYQDLPKDVQKRLQAEVDRSYNDFVALVSRNRSLDAQAVKDTEAAVFGAPEALTLGLIDAVMLPRAAFAAFQAELDNGSSPSPTKKAMTMTDTTDKTGEGDSKITSADVNAAAATAAKNEQARISGILDCEEAQGRESLARHFAFGTSMSAEDAKKALMASPKAAAAAPAEDEPAPAAAAHPGAGRLAAALDEQANKTVGVDGDKDNGEPVDRGGRLCAALNAARGVKPAGK